MPLADSRFRNVLLATLSGLLLPVASPTPAAGAGSASDTPERVRMIERQVGGVPEKASIGRYLGPLESTRRLSMVIAFEPRNSGGIEALLSELEDPASPSYHQWITPEEFGRRFGRSEAEMDEALGWLRSQGLIVDQAWPNRLFITFSGETKTVEQAFKVQMGVYRDEVENRVFHSNRQRPTLPASLAGMTISLAGLNDAYLRHTGQQGQARRRFRGGTPLAAGAAGGASRSPNFLIQGVEVLGPDDLALAYGYQSFVSGNIRGQGQKIGNIIDSDVQDSDMLLHRNAFTPHLPAPNIQRKIAPGLSNPGARLQFEAELDVCAIGEVAPSAEIDLVLVPALDTSSILTAENYAINTLALAVVNESFGGCEANNFDTGEQNLFQQARAQGTAFFASSGDEGAECSPGGTPGTRGVNLPAAYGDVTAVGGTLLQGTFNTGGTMTSVTGESVWNNPPGVRQDCFGNPLMVGGAGGGGVSTLVAKPAYQVNATGVTGGVPAGTKRVLPDVALAADPNNPGLGVLFVMDAGGNGGGFIGGGTSQSSPLMAAMWSLVNQSRGSNQGSPNTLLYHQGVNQYASGGPTIYRDVTVGNNSTGARPGCPTGATGFSAVFGYDAASGWGAPKVASLILPADLSITKTDGQATAMPGNPVTYTIVASNGGPNPVFGATVTDNFPAAITAVTWTCSASGGSSCGAASGSGNISRTVNLLVGGTVTFTAVASTSPSATGTLTNTATITAPVEIADTNLTNNSATDTDTLVQIPDLSITKTDGRATVVPSQTVTYTIVGSNLGLVVSTGAKVTDTVPASLLGATWTCAGSGGGTCTAGPVSGNINDTVNLPAGASVTYMLTGTLSATPSGLTNTATIAPPAGTNDPNPANNVATDSDAVICPGEAVIVADGRLTTGVIAPSTTLTFGSQLKIGDSYSVEFKNLTGTGTPPGTATVFAGDDGCSPASPLTTRDTTAIDPGAATTSRRVSFTATGTQPFFRVTLTSSPGAPIPFSFAVADTTLFSPAWSTNGTFDTFYSFLNTTGAPLNGTLTLLDTAGAVLSTFGLAIPPGQTASTNTSVLVVARGRTGTARFVHDGPPGAVVAEAAIANFSISPAYVQPVKFQAVRDAR
jgi:uncharacterized repeat protein (TIGR01451 family)